MIDKTSWTMPLTYGRSVHLDVGGEGFLLVDVNEMVFLYRDS